MSESITTKELSPQPVLVADRRVTRPEMSAAISEVFGLVFRYAQENGVTPGGPPITRFLDVEGEDGRMTIQPGIPVGSGKPPEDGSEGEDGAVHWDTLPGGTVVTTLHQGHYDGLRDTYASLREWIQSHGMKPTGAPWEVYLTDPTTTPDPADWKTVVNWPAE